MATLFGFVPMAVYLDMEQGRCQTIDSDLLYRYMSV